MLAIKLSTRKLPPRRPSHQDGRNSYSRGSLHKRSLLTLELKTEVATQCTNQLLVIRPSRQGLPYAFIQAYRGAWRTADAYVHMGQCDSFPNVTNWHLTITALPQHLVHTTNLQQWGSLLGTLHYTESSHRDSRQRRPCEINTHATQLLENMIIIIIIIE